MNQTNNIFNIKQSLNGDRVIGFTKSKQLKNSLFVDSAQVSTYLLDEEDSVRKHLGMIDLYKTTHQTVIPMMEDLFGNSKVLEVPEGGSVTYDLPVDQTDLRCITTKDMSDKYEYPGYDNSLFEVALSMEFQPGDILTYDAQDGDQVMVHLDIPTRQDGDSYIHTVTLQTNDPEQSFDKTFLKDGHEWFKLTNKTPEYGENFSGINMVNKPVASITCEFLMPDVRTVETFVTRKGAAMSAGGFRQTTESFMENVKRNQIANSLTNGNDVFMMGDVLNGGIDPKSSRVGSTLEYLMLMEISMMEAYEIMFAKASNVKSARGNLRTAEGLWHTMRRGKIIRYTKATGITKNHLEELSQYIYKNSNVEPSKRIIMLKAGWGAYQEMMNLIQKEALVQSAAIPGIFKGTDSQIGEKLFKGSLDNLELGLVQVKTVTFPSIGKVIVEHDVSMDYKPLADRFSAGTYAHGYNKYSYSLVAYDLTSPQVSNVDKVVKGANLVKDGNQTSNIYYVKKEGQPVITYGYEQGRMADEVGSGAKVISSLKKMGKSMWAISDSAGLMLDPGRYCTIEIQED